MKEKQKKKVALKLEVKELERNGQAWPPCGSSTTSKLCTCPVIW